MGQCKPGAHGAWVHLQKEVLTPVSSNRAFFKWPAVGQGIVCSHKCLLEKLVVLICFFDRMGFVLFLPLVINYLQSIIPLNYHNLWHSSYSCKSLSVLQRNIQKHLTLTWLCPWLGRHPANRNSQVTFNTPIEMILDKRFSKAHTFCMSQHKQRTLKKEGILRADFTVSLFWTFHLLCQLNSTSTWGETWL